MSTSLLSFNASSTTGFYTLCLHDALPICESEGLKTKLWVWLTLLAIFKRCSVRGDNSPNQVSTMLLVPASNACSDRKSIRLNSSHVKISYAVFCLKKNRLSHHIPTPHTSA